MRRSPPCCDTSKRPGRKRFSPLLNYPNAVLLIAGRVSPRKTEVVVSVHNTISASMGKSDSRRSRDIPRLMKRLFPLADEIVAPSDGVAEDVAGIARMRRDRISMIYNPVVGPSLLAQAAARDRRSLAGRRQHSGNCRRGEAKATKGLSDAVAGLRADPEGAAVAADHPRRGAGAGEPARTCRRTRSCGRTSLFQGRSAIHTSTTDRPRSSYCPPSGRGCLQC